jgi:hypothetical protein
VYLNKMHEMDIKVFQSLEDARIARAIRGEIDSKEVQLGNS